MDAYHRTLGSVTLYGPTNFSPVINHVARYILFDQLFCFSSPASVSLLLCCISMIYLVDADCKQCYSFKLENVAKTNQPRSVEGAQGGRAPCSYTLYMGAPYTNIWAPSANQLAPPLNEPTLGGCAKLTLS